MMIFLIICFPQKPNPESKEKVNMYYIFLKRTGDPVTAKIL